MTSVLGVVLQYVCALILSVAGLSPFHPQCAKSCHRKREKKHPSRCLIVLVPVQYRVSRSKKTIHSRRFCKATRLTYSCQIYSTIHSRPLPSKYNVSLQWLRGYVGLHGQGCHGLSGRAQGVDVEADLQGARWCLARNVNSLVSSVFDLFRSKTVTYLPFLQPSAAPRSRTTS